METFSLNFLLKDLKKLDKEELFEKVKDLYYENQKLTNRVFDLEELMSKQEKKIEKKKSKIDKIINYDGYNTEWIMTEKIVFILKRNKVAMSTIQVVNELLKIEPNLNEIYKDKVRTISNYIYNTLRLGFIKRSEKAVGGGYNYVIKQQSVTT
ncbi:MAG: hypothetical protein Q8L81_11390 [Bacteroidota bacterium]|nr:hypothetical protein [Bacteroidota bacterium]